MRRCRAATTYGRRAEVAPRRGLGQPQEEGGGPLPNGLLLAARREPIERVVADRLEPAEKRLVAGRLVDPEQAVAHKGGARLQSGALDLRDSTDRFDRAAPGEDAPRAKVDRLGLAQQLVVPADRRPQREMARRLILRAAGQPVETPLPEPREDSLGRKPVAAV